MSFADALRQRTGDLHGEAERSGVVLDIVRRRVTRHGYALYLRNLLPAYQQLERCLVLQGEQPALQGIARPELFRSRALESDLQILWGAGWDRYLPVLASSSRYADRVARAGRGDGSPLIAHAYTRYLGDLNGGQVLSRILARSLGIDARALSYYEFADIADVPRFVAHYRVALDRAGDALLHAGEVLEEAELAFRLNIDLSLEVQQVASRYQGATPPT
jgi:heme oxygenase (biliverdin-producing, ferredoxin)